MLANETLKRALSAHASVLVPVDLDPDAGELIAASRERLPERLAGRDRIVAVLLGSSLFFAAVAMMALQSHADVPPLLTVLLIAVYAISSRVEFEVGAGSAVPTELVLVPMLFLLPAGAVPLCVAAGLVLGGLPDLIRGRASVERIPLLLASSWHAVGPALVLLLAGERKPVWHHWPLYLSALAAQFLFDFVSSAVREKLVFGVSLRALLGYLSWVNLVDAVLAPVGLLAAFAATTGHYTFLLPLPLVGLLGTFARERRARIDNALELSQAYRGTALLLGDVIEANDAYTGTHTRDVVDLVLDVTAELGLSPRERREAELAALLHDVGKVRVPAEILNKPGPLTREERLVIQQHTIEGEAMLNQVGGMLGEIGRIVRSCHERWDGDGYPEGLAGDEIPLTARIVAACEAYSAMTTDRPYRTARPSEAAVAELERERGAQLDPEVVDALVRVIGT